MSGPLPSYPLLKRVPQAGSSDTSPASTLDAFLDYVRESKLELYPAQEEAILELLSGKNVLLNTPTGSGKSLVALALQFDAFASGRVCYYTSPIKALVNEKFFALCKDFGPENVGMITGDASVNPTARLICCTAEILANLALRQGPHSRMPSPVHDAILDEFHYYSDRDRGIAWQIPLITLTNTRFLLMSATLGDTTFFEKSLTELNHRETTLVRSTHRPVPLEFNYSENPLQDEVQKLLRAGRAPIYLVHFTQRECAERAQDFLSLDFCTKEEKRTIADELSGFKFSSPYGKEIQKLLRHGIGIHHASLLPKYRTLVERLARRGLLKIIFGTDTLGVGVNIPIRTVLLTKLCKFDGQKTTILNVRDFHQLCGRAGRKGFDDLGTVVVQAPEHIIENLRSEQKAAGDPKKLKKLVKQKPPEKGFLMWTEDTFKKLIGGTPEALVSRFKVNHALILNVLSGTDQPRSTFRQILKRCHDPASSRRRHLKNGFELFRALVERKIVEFNPLRVHLDLQEDFSLNHDLSLYLVDTLKLLDPLKPDHALDALTLVESILEDPELILRRQLDHLKDRVMRELKEQGMEFDQRIEELEKLEHPKPNREFIYSTFNEFAFRHPWIGQENIRPKSIAREMIEGYFSFGEYVREYGLERGEGLLLRYLSDVYKTLVQNIPLPQQTDELLAITVYFEELIQETDSSLLEEWNRLRGALPLQTPTPAALTGGAPKETPREVRIRTRNLVFNLVASLAQNDLDRFETLLSRPFEANQKEVLQNQRTLYFEAGHSRILTDPKARGSDFYSVNEITSTLWRIEQTLCDPEGHNDWTLTVKVHFEPNGSIQVEFDELKPIG